MRTCRSLVAFALIAGLGAGLPRVISAPQSSAITYGKPEADNDKKDSTKAPFKGMTKAQALHYYGDPDSIGHRGDEELWTYVLNAGETIAKSFIPFNYGNKLRYRLLTFKDGKVVDFHWDAPDKS
jgi:hypothetical protein